MRPLEQIADEVKVLAREVGAFIREQRKNFNQERVEVKGTHDYVSYVDKESELMIVRRLKEIVPEAAFVTEERTTQNDADADLTWVVDPLDGTSNFVHGMAPYCVCIGLRNREEVLVGVVYEVVADELFWSYKGGKAYANETVISVGRAQEVNDAFICIGYPYNVTDWKPLLLRLIDALYGNSISIRNLGSAQAEICYVACGRFDAYIESYIKPWDVTAGSIILKNAGGVMTDYSGGNGWESGAETLATNGLIHEEMIGIIKDINNELLTIN